MSDFSNLIMAFTFHVGGALMVVFNKRIGKHMYDKQLDISKNMYPKHNNVKLNQVLMIILGSLFSLFGGMELYLQLYYMF